VREFPGTLAKEVLSLKKEAIRTGGPSQQVASLNRGVQEGVRDHGFLNRLLEGRSATRRESSIGGVRRVGGDLPLYRGNLEKN